MIEGIYGLPGYGKSLYMTHLILDSLRKNRRVIANVHSKKERWEFGLWEDFINAENADCFIDEAQMWLNSRNFKNNSIEDLAVFQQSRKNGLNLTYVAQHFNRVDVAVRELTSYYHHCKPFALNTVLVRTFTPDEPLKPVKRYIFKKGPHLYDQYWTSEVIGARDGTGYRFGAITEGGVVKLESGRLTPNRTMFYYDYDPSTGSYAGAFSVPIADKDKTWNRLAMSYNVKKSQYFFVCRDFALIENRMYWTDSTEEFERNQYSIWDTLVESKLGRIILDMEDRLAKPFKL